MKALLAVLILGFTQNVHTQNDFRDYYYIYGGCHYWAMADCWIPMEQHLDDFDTSIVPTYTEEELTPMCNSFDQVQRCIQEFIDDCHPTVQTDFQSLNDSWHYICVETKQEYLKHRDCWDNDQLHEEGDEVCYNALFEQIDRLRQSDKDFDYLLERQCHFMNNYLDCVENLIKSFNCSEAAARWQRELDRRALQPLLDPGCTLDNSTGKTIYVYRTVTVPPDTEGQQDKHSSLPKGALIGCTVALGLLILAIGLMVVIKCMTNQKPQQQQNPRYSNQPAPQQHQWAAPAQAYGYGGGAVAFGPCGAPLPGKEDQQGDLPTDNPPEYTLQSGDGTGQAPPSQPPPYTGFPQGPTSIQSHSRLTAPDNGITDVE